MDSDDLLWLFEFSIQVRKLLVCPSVCRHKAQHHDGAFYSLGHPDQAQCD